MDEISIRDFTVENQGTNTFLVYRLSEKEEIDTFSYGMISNNTIRGIVPIILTQINKDRSIKFNISSRISVEQYFEGIVNKKRFLTVLSGIAGAILSGEEYMLDASAFLWNPQLIYVNVGTGEPEIICFPVKDKCGMVDLMKFYKDIVFCTRFDQSENAGYVAKIISFLNGSNNFSLPSFKKMLDELAAEKDIKAAPAATVSPTPAVLITPQIRQIPTPASASAVPPVQPAPAGSQETKKKFGLFGSAAKEKKEKTKKEKPVAAKVKKPSAPKKPQKAVPPSKFAVPGMIPSKPAAAAPLPPAEDLAPKSLPPAAPAVPVYTHPAPATKSKNFVQETTMLNYEASGETVVLSESQYTESQRPYLIRLKSDQKIPLDKDVYKIGKEQSFVDYWIADNAAVSRCHANIICKNGAFYIVDMNSKNHTYVNGSMITSNQETLLNQGDLICMADENFEFRTI